MARKFALIIATSILATSAVTALQSARADVKPIKLRIHNAAKINIQIFVQDFVGKKSDEQKGVVAPEKETYSQAIPDAKGKVDFFIQVRFVDEKKGSYYRCLAIQTDPKGESELKYNVTETFGKAVGGAGVGCRP